MLRTFFISLLACMLLSACTKVDKLSDEARITSFEITNSTDNITIDNENIVIEENVVNIPILFGRKHFPLELSVNIGLSSTTEDVMSADTSRLDMKKFIFEDIYSTQDFYLISESGIAHKAQIRLIDNRNAEVYDVKLWGLPEEMYVTYIRNNNIRISLILDEITYPVEIYPLITKTEGATYKDFTEGEALRFDSIETKTITLVSKDGDEKKWHLELVPPIANMDFERWLMEKDEDGNDICKNIDPTPAVGYGWGTANNRFVSGTQRIPYDGSRGGKFAAEMTTSIQDLSSLGIGELITAATLFAGEFRMKLQFDNPPLMTYFGIPFIQKPVAFEVEAKYQPGPKMLVSRKIGKKYVIEDYNGDNAPNYPGYDRGHIWIELLHWSKNSKLEYHREPVEGLTILGEGELIFDQNKIDNIGEWQVYRIPMTYKEHYNHLAPTHIAITMSSSIEGDYFIGAPESKLTVNYIKIKN